MRRIARLLVERRDEAFESRYSRDESVKRVASAVAEFKPKGMVYETTWREEGGRPVLGIRFAPSRSTRFFLNTASLVMTLLLVGTLYAFLAPGETTASRILVACLTAGAILAFPFVVVAYGSRREAEESVLRRRIKKAIVDAEEE